MTYSGDGVQRNVCLDRHGGVRRTALSRDEGVPDRHVLSSGSSHKIMLARSGRSAPKLYFTAGLVSSVSVLDRGVKNGGRDIPRFVRQSNI
jgi:hypothetical protein